MGIDPAASAKRSGLRYVSSETTPGISRRRKGKAFEYLSADGGRITNIDTLRRIKALAIPPAWTDVWVCPYDNGHLQATGRDNRGRKQYRYHAQWTHGRNDTKFHRMIAFGEVLPLLRKRVHRDLAQRGLSKDKVVATVIAVSAHTCIRVGNEKYRRANGTFGLTTLRNRHVNVGKSRIEFFFRGKGGKNRRVTLNNRRLARLVRHCQELPGQTLFQYKDEAGALQPIGSSDINDYLRDATQQEFTSKDLRTWAGTLQAARSLSVCDPAMDTASKKRKIAAAVNDAASFLGNLPATCRKHYVHPVVLESYTVGTPCALPPKPPNGDADDLLSSTCDNERKALLRFLRRDRQRRGVKSGVAHKSRGNRVSGGGRHV